MNKENIRQISVTSFSLIFFILLQILSAGASDFVIGLSELSVNHLTIYAENEITVEGRYSVSSAGSSKVRLELLFDGNVVDSTTEYRSTGNYDVEFTYTPSSSNTGDHDIGIRARIYENNVLKDEDVITKSIYLHPRGTNHALEITSIINKKLVSPSERFPVDVEIRNTGDREENDVIISAKIGGTTYLSQAFSIGPEKSASRTIYVSAPSESGNYDIAIKARNSRVSIADTANVDVQRTSISLTLKKTSANTGEWIGIEGYATRGRYASEGAISLYLDNVPSGIVLTRENGYYSTKVKFDTPGSHRIMVMAGGLTTSQTIYVSSPQAYQYIPAAQPAPQQITIPGGNYTAIIIVTGESQYIVYPEAPKALAAAGNASNITNNTANITETKKDKYSNSSFVNIDISANELDTVQNSGNLLKITVTNHLGRSEKFSVSTDFKKEWTYLPGAEVILNGEKNVFEIYFTPDSAGTFSGNVFVTENNKTIKTIPLSLFVAPREEAAEAQVKESSAINLFLGAEKIAILAAALIFVIFTLRYAVSRKPKALEPKMISPSQNVSEILKAMSSPFSEMREKTEKNENNPYGTKNAKSGPNGSIFFVPRKNVII